jgi:FKBP-type peptidyl-prolyl cis-trans isomerase FkpA/FKBP-type peptidyl-prolyl cis-trans isomerase FklB
MRILGISIAILALLVLLRGAQSQDNLPQPSGRTPGAAQRLAPPATADPATYRQQTSYALGRNFASNLRANEIQCDIEFLLAGIRDTLQNAQPKWTDEQLEPIMQQFGQEMQQKAEARMERQAIQNEKEATAFLAQNANREGVQTTASGLQYRVIRQGNGPSPTLRDRVRCNYRGTLLNGMEFDNSAHHGGPAEFGVNEVIPGWTEALQKMHVGDKWQLFVPPKLAYELNPPPRSPIEPNSLLIFEIELLEVLPQ